MGVIALVGACSLERPVHTCDEWTDCGDGGACEPDTSTCSFPDPDCPSGRRFSEFGRSELARTCVVPADEPGRGALCDSEGAPCAEYRECIDNRCVSTVQLSSNVGIVCARCALDSYSPLNCWGDSTAFLQTPPQHFPFRPCGVDLPGPPPEVIACNTFTQPDFDMWCPSCPNECRTTPGPTCEGSDTSVSVAVGENHVCFDNGRAFCVGDNARGQLGQYLPFVHLDRDYKLFAPGAQHTCARLFLDTQVYCWGDNRFGQLGLPPSPDPILEADAAPYDPKLSSPGESIRNVTFLSADATYTCAAANDRVACWGDTPTEPGRVEIGDGQIISLETGSTHACVVRGGQVVCWGGNEHGQAAPGDARPEVEPTVVLPEVTSFVSVVAGRAHTCAVTDAGTIHCWGDGSLDQLGAGTAGPGPVLVRATPPVAGRIITAGSDFTCALHADDRVRCWGDVLELGEERYEEPDICVR